MKKIQNKKNMYCREVHLHVAICIRHKDDRTWVSWVRESSTLTSTTNVIVLDIDMM